MRKKRIFAFLLCTAVTSALFSSAASEYVYAAQSRRADVDVSTFLDRKPISPYIYGINDTADLSGGTFTAIKQGGIEFSTYNWENNFSNSGESNHSTNENAIFERYTVDTAHPAAAIDGLVEIADANNINYKITTLPMLGYAAADIGGPILDGEEAPSDRWEEVIPRKNGVFSARPDTSDDVVYIDEYISCIVKRYGKSSSTGINAYCLDSDPTKWTSLHPYAISELTISEYIEKTKSTASAVKSIDPDALIIGGGFGDIEALATFGNNPEWKKKSADYNWFADYYLDKMKAAEVQAGRRLVDAFDVCYYPKDVISSGVSILESNTPEANDMRIEATRALWDSDYADMSRYKQYYPLLPTLQASINEYYPDTKLTVSEYNFGGGADVSGGIAQIDVLGNFAHEGVYLACLNPSEGEDIRYQKSAINLFTNYDGNGNGIGDTIVRSAVSDEELGAYAAVNSEGMLCVILVNRSDTVSINADINIESDIEYTNAEVYGFSSASSEIKNITAYGMITGNILTYSVKPRNAVIVAFDYVHAEQTAPIASETDVITPAPATSVPDESTAETNVPLSTPENQQTDHSDSPKNDEGMTMLPVFKIGAIIFGLLTAVMIGYLFISEKELIGKLKNKN